MGFSVFLPRFPRGSPITPQVFTGLSNFSFPKGKVIMSAETVYCAGEQRRFPTSDFRKEASTGALIHRAKPEHYADTGAVLLGEIVNTLPLEPDTLVKSDD
jgi:hypothetical protein